MSEIKSNMTFQVRTVRVDAHDNIRKYGTIFNMLVSGTQLSGELQRK